MLILNDGRFYAVVDWSTRGKNFAAGQEDGRLMLYDRVVYFVDFLHWKTIAISVCHCIHRY